METIKHPHISAHNIRKRNYNCNDLAKKSSSGRDT